MHSLKHTPTNAALEWMPMTDLAKLVGYEETPTIEKYFNVTEDLIAMSRNELNIEMICV